MQTEDCKPNLQITRRSTDQSNLYSFFLLSPPKHVMRVIFTAHLTASCRANMYYTASLLICVLFPQSIFIGYFRARTVFNLTVQKSLLFRVYIQIFLDNGVVISLLKNYLFYDPYNIRYYTKQSETFTCIYLMYVFFLPFIHINLI